MSVFRHGASNPVAAADFFRLVKRVYLETILGIDPISGLPLKQGGICGHVLDFIGSVEEQADKTLRMHLLIVIANLGNHKAPVAPRLNDYGEDAWEMKPGQQDVEVEAPGAKLTKSALTKKNIFTSGGLRPSIFRRMEQVANGQSSVVLTTEEILAWNRAMRTGDLYRITLYINPAVGEYA